MHMILIKSDCVNINREPFLEPGECRKNELFNVRFEKRFTIFYSDLNVIITFRDVVVPIPDSIVSFDISS